MFRWVIYPVIQRDKKDITEFLIAFLKLRFIITSGHNSDENEGSENLVMVTERVD